MSVLPIAAIAPESLGAILPASPAAGATVGRTDFSTMIDNAVSGLNSDLNVAETGLQGLATGDAKSIHDVMIGVEQAKLEFQLVMQIRNRVLEAYQDLMRTQV